MKRKEFFQLIQPLTDRLFNFAYAMIPDDLQAEQLVIDGLNAFLLKERKTLLRKDFESVQKKEQQVLRRIYFKNILRYMSDIGIRRAVQLNEQLKLTRPEEFSLFYNLDPKVRLVTSLRYDGQFSMEEIEEIVQMPRFEVIEKIHNGRFLLMNNLNPGMSV